jgi:hypothetical protein
MFTTGCISVERKNIHRDRTACGADKFSDTSRKFSVGLPSGGDTVVYAQSSYPRQYYSQFGAYGPGYGSSVHPGGNPYLAARATEATMGISSEPWWVSERRQSQVQSTYISPEISVIVTPGEYQSEYWRETQRNYGVHTHGGRNYNNTYVSPQLPGQPPPRSGWQPHRSR